MKKRIFILLAVSALLIASVCFAEGAATPSKSGILGGLGDRIADAAKDVGKWATGAANDAGEWIAGAATDAWHWTSAAASKAWDGVSDFFNPPEATTGTANIPAEPALPEGTQKMYLGYEVQRTGLDNGYANSKSIGRNDPHFGLTLGKFYVSGFTSAISEDDESFIFLKTVGDNVELHFELTQDIDMLGGDPQVTINADSGGYDKYFGISPTYMGRGTLIVRHTDYQNNVGEPQVYTDYLSAKMSGSADTVISLNEEGDYEVALDYEIRQNKSVLGTAATRASYTNYRLFFTFSVRNGNCMVFPFDVATGEELQNTASTPNGFRLDLAYSRYLDINVKYSVLQEGDNGYVEDVRFNRPARDGESYTKEGIYTISVGNRYTGEQTQKQLYVGSDAQYSSYINKGYTVEQLMQALNEE